MILALATRHRLAWALLAVALAAVGIGWCSTRRCRRRPARCSCGGCCRRSPRRRSLLALVLGRRLVSYALVLLAALELGVWVFLRRDGAFRALIPTDAPFWLDRAVMAATGVVAVAAAIGAAAAMYRVE